MTTIDVREAPAGPAMDAACAEAMGWRYHDGRAYEDGANEDMAWSHSFRWWPSTDIAQAWKLVRAMDCPMSLEHRVATDGALWWAVTIYGDEYAYADADSAPLAICRAFLLAHGVTELEVNDG